MCRVLPGRGNQCVDRTSQRPIAANQPAAARLRRRLLADAEHLRGPLVPGDLLHHRDLQDPRHLACRIGTTLADQHHTSGGSASLLNISGVSPFKGVRTQNYLSSVDADAAAPIAGPGDDVDLSDLEGDAPQRLGDVADEPGAINAPARRSSLQRKAPSRRVSYDWLSD